MDQFVFMKPINQNIILKINFIFLIKRNNIYNPYKVKNFINKLYWFKCKFKK